MIAIAIVFFVSCIITVFADWIVKRVLTRKIKVSKTAKESVLYRKIYRRIRKMLKLLFVILFVSEIILFCVVVFSNGWQPVVVYVCLPPMIMLGNIVLSKMVLPVSGITIDDLGEGTFDLFLRGFSSDNYCDNWMMDYVSNYDSKERYSFFSKNEVKEESEYIEFFESDDFLGTKNKIQIEKPFTERSFYNAYRMAGGNVMYCVGMTKEMDSPEGSTRIYLDDETWQNDVGNLIDKANHVFILVNYSDSCVWEILQCSQRAIGKSFFIIHNADHLQEIFNKLQDKTPRCLIDGLEKGAEKIKHSIVFVADGETKVLHYQNTMKGYEELFSLLSGMGKFR